MFAAGYLLWLLQRVAFGTPDGGVRGRAHPRRARHRVGRVGADARPDRRARRRPEPHLPRHRRRRWSTASRAARRRACCTVLTPPCSPPLVGFVRAARRLARARARDHPRRRRSSCCCWSTCSSERQTKWAAVVDRRHRPARRRSSRCSRWPSTAHDRSMFGGAYVVDNFALVLKALFLVAGYVVVLLSTNYIAEGDYWEGEYYLLLAVVGARHDGHGVGPRPHHDLRRPRAAVDPGLHARRLAQARPQGQRGRAEVLPDGRVRLGGDALRHVADLRRHRHHRARRHRRRRSTAASATSPVVTLGIVFVLVGFALQGVGGAVPHLGARHLRGRAHAGHRVPVGGVEGGRLRGHPGADLRRLLRPRRRVRADDVGPRRAHDDRRQPHRPAPDQHRAHARLLRRRPGRLHPRPARRRRARAPTVAADALVAVVTYLLIYAAMNLGAFAVVIAVARKTRSGEIDVVGRPVRVRARPRRRR